MGIIAILQSITMYIDMKFSQISQAMSHYVLMNYSKQLGDKIIQTSSDSLCDNIVGRQWQPTCLHFTNNFAQNTKCDLTFTCFEGRGCPCHLVSHHTSKEAWSKLRNILFAQVKPPRKCSIHNFQPNLSTFECVSSGGSR